jgi:hypothetical protein
MVKTQLQLIIINNNNNNNNNNITISFAITDKQINLVRLRIPSI